jgi:1-deoxy-D-xylulose-5-phosphate reductoisomerase
MEPGGKMVAILGSTGSIGVRTLDVIRSFPGRFRVKALAAGRNVERLAAQVKEFRPRLAAVLTEDLAVQLRDLIGPGFPVEVVFGEEGYVRAAALEEAETVVSAMVGAAGLRPTLAAVRAGRRVALANKEALVMAGGLVMAEARSSGAAILPVDSEHSAVFQVLEGQRREAVRRILLTASGGPFLGRSRAALAGVSPEEALAHPRWRMGAKISIDSATLMNKGLEAIEARWLFDCPLDRIDIVIHPESVVHSLVEFADGSVLAQMGIPDMRLPIAYALTYPERLPLDLPRLDLAGVGNLSFRRPEPEAFPCLGLALAAGRRGGTAPVVLNAANEAAVQAFLNREIGFLDIGRVIEQALSQDEGPAAADLGGILEVDRETRRRAQKIVSELKGGLG